MEFLQQFCKSEAFRNWALISWVLKCDVSFSPHPWWRRTVSWRVGSGWEETEPHRGCRALPVWAGLSGWWRGCRPADRRWEETRLWPTDQGFDLASLLLQKERKRCQYFCWSCMKFWSAFYRYKCICNRHSFKKTLSIELLTSLRRVFALE